MNTKLKIDKKAGTFKLNLPEGCSCVIVCTNGVNGLVPISIETGINVKVDRIEELLKNDDISQVTLIPINFEQYIHVSKDWKALK